MWYFKHGSVGERSSNYDNIIRSETGNNVTVKNGANLEIIDQLMKMDTKNGVDSSKVVENLCLHGESKAVKVRKTFILVKVKIFP